MHANAVKKRSKTEKENKKAMKWGGNQLGVFLQHGSTSSKITKAGKITTTASMAIGTMV